MASRRSRRRRPRPEWLDQLIDSDVVWSIVAGLIVIAVIAPRVGSGTADYAAGDIADADLLAPVDVQVPDPVLTERRRDEAEALVLQVYDHDPTVWRDPVASLNTLFAWGREQVSESETDFADQDEEARAAVVEVAESVAGLPLPERFVPTVWTEGFTAETELALERLLRNFMQHSLLGDIDVLGLGSANAIDVRDIVTQSERRLEELTSVRDFLGGRTGIARRVAETLDLPAATEAELGSFAASLLRPNLTFNSNETQARRTRARDSIVPAVQLLKRGQAIVRAGDVITEQDLRELQALSGQWSRGQSWSTTGGSIVLILLSVYALWRFVEHYRRRFHFQRVKRIYLLTLMALVGSVLMTRLMLFVGDAIAGATTGPPFNDPESWYFAIPFGLAPLLILLLADTQVAWAFVAVQAVAVATMTRNLELTVFAILGSFAAIYGMSQYKQRTEMLRTGFLVAAVNAATVLGLAISARPPLTLTTTGFQVGMAVVGGLQMSMMASALLPMLESLFGTLTDVKMLELSNMNLPLLKRLAIVAPGTYHHSVVVGSLAEKAAEAIDANPLFARVAAYYHDIGKMRQPQYFVENQVGDVNPHDKLSPHMSSLILGSHIKEGVAYAEENRLPRPIIDVIEQHHGTRLMKFFYHRANTLAGEEGDAVSDQAFRYPGPRPRTKEAAIIMLADTVEAISRVTTDPTPTRVRTMVHDTIREVLEDQQLDQCDVTLAELREVGDAFIGVLVGMHHQRIEYPGDEREAVEENLVDSAKTREIAVGRD